MAPEYPYQLRQDEKLIWSGRPRQGIFLRPNDSIILPFAGLWCVMAVTGLILAVFSTSPLISLALSIVPAIVGFYLAVGRFRVDANIRKNTAYFLTNQRVIFLTSEGASGFKFIELAKLPEPKIDVGRDGYDSIYFGRKHISQTLWEGLPIWSLKARATPAFAWIQNAREVFDLLQQAKSGWMNGQT